MTNGEVELVDNFTGRTQACFSHKDSIQVVQTIPQMQPSLSPGIRTIAAVNVAQAKVPATNPPRAHRAYRRRQPIAQSRELAISPVSFCPQVSHAVIRC